MHISLVSSALAVALLLPAVSNAAAPAWNINSLFSLPNWLSMSGEQRTRYETLDEQFRADKGGNDQILVFRTKLLTKIMLDNWDFGLEVMDSRQELADENSFISTSIVNPTDILQAYAQWTMQDAFAKNSISTLRVGRFTMDIGSRRFVARNRFRNTINAFTGAEWQWFGADRQNLRVFYTLPVTRLPNERERLEDNRSEGDEQDFDIAFWGANYKLSEHALKDSQSEAEIFYFGLDEQDTNEESTENRDIHTVGGRLYKKSARSQIDYQLEAAIQFGESRSTTSSGDRKDLDHFAHFSRAELGYSFDQRWSPRLSAQIDFASGDDDPADGDNNRFDTLYGARRFDYGPTGIYGPFARENLISPGLRLQLKPSPDTSLFFAHCGYWLASKKDAWTAAGVQDPEGDSGSFIGHQIETRLRWDVVPKTLRLEFGGAYLFKGKFAKSAPNANNEGDPNYFYSQFIFTF